MDRSLSTTGALALGLLVAPLSAMQPDEIRLANGDRLTGTVVSSDASGVTLEHATLGVVTVPVDQIASVNGAGDDPARSSRSDLALSMLQETEQTIPGWDFHFDLAAGLSEGNSENATLMMAVTGKKETELTRTTVDAGWFYGQSDNETSENRLTVGALHDWLLPNKPKWIAFVSARYDRDQFTSWDHRLGLFGGLGYKLVEKDNYQLTLRGGAGAVREWGSDDDGWRPEGLLGFDLNWDITEKQNFTLAFTYHPYIEDFSEYRTVTTANWAVVMDEAASMSLFVGALHEYDSDVDPGRDHNDLKLAAGLSFDF